MTRLDLTPFYRSAIGFDRMANLVDNLFQTSETGNTNWPPYNIEKIGETDYRITMAVAGFFEEDLDVTIHEGTLIVTGQNSQETIDEEKTYLYRGIAGRQFERRFQLADFIEIKSASLQNGLLHINLKREVPEQMKPRKISISSQPALDKTIN
ncbi:Hsp20 family protein [Alphaproteobacteria bacterium]|nr:Hsp20 family protein [Alphaproteobacteria bacterium]MDA9190241.1 Hsp20 family protein [Alphaproteobacteria bacterium]MDC0394889.1 Hsp20 family protein [Alphaproteobacteria bacterium]